MDRTEVFRATVRSTKLLRSRVGEADGSTPDDGSSLQLSLPASLRRSATKTCESKFSLMAKGIVSPRSMHLLLDILSQVPLLSTGNWHIQNAQFYSQDEDAIHQFGWVGGVYTNVSYSLGVLTILLSHVLQSFDWWVQLYVWWGARRHWWHGRAVHEKLFWKHSLTAARK